MISVLVVDDQPDLRQLLRVVLEMEGASVREAASGPAAVALLTGSDLPDIVVLDVQMPDMDGWTTLEAIRADARTAHIPVLLCTVKGAARDLARGWKLGCDGYITKPFDNKQFADAVFACASRDEPARAEVRERGLAEARRRAELEPR